MLSTQSAFRQRICIFLQFLKNTNPLSLHACVGVAFLLLALSVRIFAWDSFHNFTGEINQDLFLFLFITLTIILNIHTVLFVLRKPATLNWMNNFYPIVASTLLLIILYFSFVFNTANFQTIRLAAVLFSILASIFLWVNHLNKQAPQQKTIETNDANNSAVRVLSAEFLAVSAGFAFWVTVWFARFILIESLNIPESITSTLVLMSTSFVVIMPFVLSTIAIRIAHKTAKGNIGWKTWLFRPWISVCIFLTLCAIGALEGTICILMALPLFLIISSVAGVIGGLIMKYTDKGNLHALALPLPLLLLDVGVPLPQAPSITTKSIEISAPPSMVWQQINHVENIQAHEFNQALTYKIGVPPPVSVITLSKEQNLIRKIRWGKNIRFDEIITAWEPNKKISWIYKFSADSVPPNALDDHIKLGGRYFDMHFTRFDLRPNGKGGTHLTITSQYRVSTHFNWYAKPLGHVLIGDFSNNILSFYKNRSERAISQKN